MTNYEKKQKRIEIFGKDYDEKIDTRFHDIDNDPEIVNICDFARKGYDLITVQDVINYIKDRKRKVFDDFIRCCVIARDSVERGRLWLPDNPLATLMKRDDISIFERTAMYGVLVSALMLDYEEENK